MTQEEIVARYQSDIKFVKNLFENESIDRGQFDDMIANIDSKFFNDIDMLAIVTPTAELERILQYS